MLSCNYQAATRSEPVRDRRLGRRLRTGSERASSYVVLMHPVVYQGEANECHGVTRAFTTADSNSAG